MSAFLFPAPLLPPPPAGMPLAATSAGIPSEDLLGGSGKTAFSLADFFAPPEDPARFAPPEAAGETAEQPLDPAVALAVATSLQAAIASSEEEAPSHKETGEPAVTSNEEAPEPGEAARHGVENAPTPSAAAIALPAAPTAAPAAGETPAAAAGEAAPIIDGTRSPPAGVAKPSPPAAPPSPADTQEKASDDSPIALGALSSPKPAGNAPQVTPPAPVDPATRAADISAEAAEPPVEGAAPDADAAAPAIKRAQPSGGQRSTGAGETVSQPRVPPARPAPVEAAPIPPNGPAASVAPPAEEPAVPASAHPPEGAEAPAENTSAPGDPPASRPKQPQMYSSEPGTSAPPPANARAEPAALPGIAAPAITLESAEAPQPDPRASPPEAPQRVVEARLAQVPIQIGLRALEGLNRFEIRLDPKELGRIDVSLDIRENGEVSARLVVDRVETLALLQRDARHLERAFEQAGLRASDGGVEISLRQDGSQNSSHDRNGRDAEVSGNAAAKPLEAALLPLDPPARAPAQAGRVDLRI